MSQSFFVGVDGGATKSIIRVEDESGQVLGQVSGGPANIRTSVTQAWHSIESALERILKPLGISQKTIHLHAGLGLAGCESAEAYQACLNHPHSFKTLLVTSDAHIACLGAHKGQDGAIIIAGTGVAGYQIQDKQTAKISGWGFPYDDEGSGAWLGLEAMKLTLASMDGRKPRSDLTHAIFSQFENDSALLTWLYQANSTAFAKLAPLVIEHSEAGDATAMELLQKAAKAIDVVGSALERAQTNKTTPLPCALLGGIAPFLAPYLSEALRVRLVPCQTAPEAGAVMMVRASLSAGSGYF